FTIDKPQLMSTELYNKVALITGAGSGIGQATAILFARNGAKVIVSDIDEKGGRETVAQIKKEGGEAAFVLTDVSQSEQVAEMVQQTVTVYGSLDIAFNNAGIGGESNPVADMTVSGWNKIIDVNLNSVFYCMKFE